MSFPPLAGGDHAILSSEFCSGYVDISGVWNTGFYCPQTGSTLAVFCCGTPTYKYCCTSKPENGTGAGIVEEYNFTGLGGRGTGGTTLSRPTGGITENSAGDLVTIDSVGNDYSGATRMRPASDEDNFDSNDLTSLNLSDVPIIFGVACGVAAVLILVILVVFYLTSCCAHYHQLAQNRKRRSSMPGIYRGVATTNTSTNSGLVNLYSPTHSAGGATPGSLPGSLVGGAGILAAAENTQTYIVHHHHHSNPPASPDSCSTSADHYPPMGMTGGGGGSTSMVTTPLDIEWSSTAQYHQKPQQSNYSSAGQLQQQQQQPQTLNLLSNHIITDNRIHYTVHQTQNRLAVALTGSMNRLSERSSPCPNPSSSSYPVNIPLTPPDGYSYPRQIPRGLSPPPQYSSSMMARAESPPYYPSYDNPSSAGSSMDHETSMYNQQLHHNYLSRTSTLPLSLSRKPPIGATRPLVTSPGPYGSNLPTPQQPKSILRTSQNYRRVVTNETPPPVPPHNSNSTVFFGAGGPSYTTSSGSMEGATGMDAAGIRGSSGNITYRNVDSRTNLSSQPLLLLESKVDNGASAIRDDGQQDDDNEEDETGLHTATVIRRSSVSTGVNASSVEEEEEEEEEEGRDRFDIHDIDSDALSRLIELDLDSKL